MKRELLLGVILALAACGAEGGISRFSEGRIVGGEATTIEEHPYQVSIIYNNEHVCGGSLISSRWILTAAHCIDGLTTSLLNVRAGSTYRSSGGTLITSISSVIIHEYYDEDSYDYDVGLMQLTSALALSTTVATVTLPSSSYTIDIGTQCTVAGWGKTSYGGTLSETLLYLTVPIVSQTSCSATYIYRNTVTDQMICAGYTTGTMDTCQGDSGGPLVYNGIQVGIVSWGAECATVGYPGVYTRVSAIREWITKRASIYNAVTMYLNSLFTELTMIVRCFILLVSYTGYLQGTEQASRIVGGSYTSIEQYPYQASLQRNGHHVCGGSIISNTWILTAAHCIRNYSHTVFKVRTGSSYYDSGGRLTSVACILVNENFDLITLDYDIAAVELTRPLAFNSHTLPIALATRAQVLRVGQVATVTGWGTTMSSGTLSRRLQKVDLPLIAWADCLKSYVEHPITERMLCAGHLHTGGQDACQGDSGGPIVLNGKLIGIVSWGFGCALPSYPGVYTRVLYFRDWIEYNTNL
ncbi:transmembrane protease serine 9 [Neodiprion lecontei]|uniref:Transmembrane protease serine 9 n=1 Tax=Neodiprion lecontei TaxID=441921 RepID=A0ABM3GFK0_NEOLC|nr:transmembrane protease serine 9 [Neodiprion lecontei]